MKRAKRGLSPELINRLVVGLAVITGAIVRFKNIARASIWHDEGYTMMLSPRSPAQIIAGTARDVHPPLYYEILHFWMKLFGSSELGARSLSAVCLLIAIVVGFGLVRHLFGDGPARLAAVYLALGPFLVRYSQEARMYAMVALWVLLATYFLVKALDAKRATWWWIGYSLAIAAALYTHYYAVFAIAGHWLYVATRSRKSGQGLRSGSWWASNIAAAALFAPWVPSAYSQFKRVQAAFWIPKVTMLTIPSTIAQFLTFTDLGAVQTVVRLSGFAVLVALTIGWLIQKPTKDRPARILVTALTFLAPVAVFVLSFKRPIYVDRYFVFAAVGFYILLAALTIEAWPFKRLRLLQSLAVLATIATFGFGIHNVYVQATHNMKAVGTYVDRNYGSGDLIVSGELYTFFDFSYYNHTGIQTELLAPNGVSGYGETSLIYNRPGILVKSFADLHPASGYVWVIGKPNTGDFSGTPANWHLLNSFQRADSEVERFQVTASH